MRARRHRRGNYASFVSLMLMMLLGFAAVAIDGAMVMVSDMQAQFVADAGAHAGAMVFARTGDQDAARDAAATVMELNYVNGEAVDVDEAVDIDFGGFNWYTRAYEADAPYTNAIRTTVRRTWSSPGGPLDLHIGPVLGADLAYAQAFGEAVGAVRPRQVLVLQDLTSDWDDANDAMRWAKYGDVALLQWMHHHGWPGDEIGMITFAGQAELFTEFTDIRFENLDVRDQWHTLDICNDGPGNPRPHLIRCDQGGGGTDHADALELALDTFDDANPTTVKVAVLITNDVAHCNSSSGSCGPNRVTDAELAAAALDAAGVHTYVLSYNPSGDSAQTAWLSTLTTGDGTFVEITDPTRIRTELEGFASNVSSMLVK